MKREVSSSPSRVVIAENICAICEDELRNTIRFRDALSECFVSFHNIKYRHSKEVAIYQSTRPTFNLVTVKREKMSKNTSTSSSPNKQG
ncbi:hypothetical protein NPIL_283371 [Nephila pilipes]|uniref:Uncharacterized protein n=1 Tax=Nephila pilipes TaxID=299642 RepID=A0A8X6UQI6_NEPPI|nr:hypothetical protein NPIL_283371 [Nephila pilipes]